jgi:hypothetical protein
MASQKYQRMTLLTHFQTPPKPMIPSISSDTYFCSNNYKMCHGNRSGMFQIEENVFIECQSPYTCFKQAELDQEKAKMHIGCTIKVFFEGNDTLFCLTCRLQQIRAIRQSEQTKTFNCHNYYFDTCNGNTIGTEKDRVRCNLPYPCKTKDGTKATMHRWCAFQVKNIIFFVSHAFCGL